MKRILAVVLIAAMLCCMGGCAKTEAEPLKVMSFNIQTHSNGEVFYIREEMMTEFIAEWQPDSIGMQEVTGTWRKSLDATCFGEQYSSVGNSTMKTGEMNAIFYRNDKFTLIDSGTFWLSDTPDVAGSKFEDSGEPRTCTWARLKNQKTAEEFVHLNTHLDIGGSEVRLKQGNVVLEFIQGLGDVPLILTGYFNQVQKNSSGEVYPLYQQMTESLADARMTAPDTVSPTEWASMVQYHREGEKYNPARQPIDYIFYTPEHFEPTVYRNILYIEDEIFTISDHLAQYAEFTLK